MKIQLRAAEPNDSEIIAELIVQAFASRFIPILGEQATVILHDWFRLSQRHVWTTTLAEIDEQVVGFIILNFPTTSAGNDERWLWQALRRQHTIIPAACKFMALWLRDSDYQTTVRELYVEMIGVLPAWQRKGVGRKLLSHAEILARNKRIIWLTLSVLSDNEAALRLYHQAGFTIYRQQRRGWLGRGLQPVFRQADYLDMQKRLSD